MPCDSSLLGASPGMDVGASSTYRTRANAQKECSITGKKW